MYQCQRCKAGRTSEVVDKKGGTVKLVLIYRCGSKIIITREGSVWKETLNKKGAKCVE